MYTEEFSQILQNSIRIHKLKLANGASFGQDYTYSNGADGDGTLTKVVSSATMDGYGFYPSVTYTYTPPAAAHAENNRQPVLPGV